MCDELLNNKEYSNYQTGEKLDLERVSELKDNAMLKVKPELWRIWDFEKNNELGYDIWKVTQGSGKKVYWYCDECKDSYPQLTHYKVSSSGCAICAGRYVTLKNAIVTTNHTVAKMMLNSEDMYKYTKNSHKKVDWKCPHCGEIIENKQIKSISTQGLSCPNCSKGYSYPERMMRNILKNMDVLFKTQKSFKWSKNRKYDFYFIYNNESVIVETHGGQHYNGGFKTLGGRSAEEEKVNDKYKYDLAIQNGIKPENYIIIDCRKSEFEFIKNNILNSRLKEVFDLSEIDWREIDKVTSTSTSVEILKLFKNDMSVDEIVESIKMQKSYVIYIY